MLRRVIGCFVVFVILIGTAIADEFTGTFVKFENDKVTVTIKGEEKTFPLFKTARAKFKKGDQDAATYLKSLKKGANLKFTTDDDTITEIMVGKKK